MSSFLVQRTGILFTRSTPARKTQIRFPTCSEPRLRPGLQASHPFDLGSNCAPVAKLTFGSGVRVAAALNKAQITAHYSFASGLEEVTRTFSHHFDFGSTVNTATQQTRCWQTPVSTIPSAVTPGPTSAKIRALSPMWHYLRAGICILCILYCTFALPAVVPGLVWSSAFCKCHEVWLPADKRRACGDTKDLDPVSSRPQKGRSYKVHVKAS